MAIASTLRHSLRWRIAFLVSAAIAISYLDRQTLPWALSSIQRDIPISNEIKATLDSAFLFTYGLMYLGGGRLLDFLGTRRGFALIMLFWSVSCASHGLAGNYGLPLVFGFSFSVLMLAGSRLLLGMGEGGGFPAATRVVAEWFPVNERSTAMGIINGGSAVGQVVAPLLIAFVLKKVTWFGLVPWRWVFILTGLLGLLWTLWWWLTYQAPEQHPKLSAEERALIQSSSTAAAADSGQVISLRTLLSFRETWAVIFAKFLSDGAWYFYIFWLLVFSRMCLPSTSTRRGRSAGFPLARRGSDASVAVRCPVGCCGAVSRSTPPARSPWAPARR